jgi:hypothetical protein
VVANVLRTFKIKVMTVGAILTIEEIQRRGCECQLHLTIAWMTEQTLNIIFIITDNDGISTVPKGVKEYDEREVGWSSDSW